MAAQLSLPSSIEDNYDMVKYFQMEASPLKFDIQKKEWVFTFKVSVNIAATATKHITRTAIDGALQGAALEGILASVVSVGNSLWKGTSGGEIFLIELAADAVRAGIKHGVKGAKRGAVMGVAKGVIEARANIIYRAPYAKLSRNDFYSNKNNRVLIALFKKVAGTDRICCPVSGRVFHIPLRTDCHRGDYRAIHHVFDSSVVMSDFNSKKKSIECPIDGCTKQIDHTNVTIDKAIRLRVSDVIKRSLTWLANQDVERKDITSEEREEIIENLTDGEYLRGNEDQIVLSIRNQSLEGRDLRVLSNLVNKALLEYNKSIDDVYRKLSRALVDDIDKLDTRTLSTYQEHLIRWLNVFKIDINQPEQP